MNIVKDPVTGEDIREMKDFSDVGLNIRIYVKGKSKHGKNRINEHGNVWCCTNYNPSTNKIQLTSDKTGYIRWVKSPVDVDFELIKP